MSVYLNGIMQGHLRMFTAKKKAFSQESRKQVVVVNGQEMNML
jgi:hypothetical protein